MNPMEAFATAASKLESQVVRNPDLPPVYREHIRDAFAAMDDVLDLLAKLGSPLCLCGMTEDGRMFKLANAEGFVIAHTHTREMADVIIALSRIGG